MSDALPTISADQLTKAVSLAAAGTLSALEAEAEDEPGEEPHKNDARTKPDKGSQSLKLLEMLSSSVTSGLNKLNHLDLDKPCSSYLLTNKKVAVKSNKKGQVASVAVVKKYSSRKNYKLMPPLIPSQIWPNMKKPSPRFVPQQQQQQVVTLSHQLNIRNPQELKSMPVRPARYTTNYLVVRTQILPSSLESGSGKVTLVSASSSVAGTAAFSTRNTDSIIPESAVSSTGSAAKLSPGTSILFSLPAADHPSPGPPSGTSAVSSVGGIKKAPRLVQKIQPLFRLPLSVNTLQPNLVQKTTLLDKETSSSGLTTVKEDIGQHLPNPAIADESQMSSTGMSPATSRLPTSAAASHMALTTSSSSEAEVTPSHISPVTIKLLNSSPTVTVDLNSTQPGVSSSGSPTSQVASSPGNTASLGGSNISTNPGQILLASPSFRLISAKDSVPAFGSSRMKSPILLAYSANSMNKLNKATQVTGSTVAKYQISPSQFLAFNASQAPKTDPPASLGLGSSSGCNTITSTSVSSNTVQNSTATTTRPNCGSTENLLVKSTSVALNLSKPGPDIIYTSPGSSRPVTETFMSMKNTSRGNVEKLTGASTVQPGSGLQPISSDSCPQDRSAASSVVMLCSASSFSQPNNSTAIESYPVPISRTSGSHIPGKYIPITSATQPPLHTFLASGTQQLKVPVSTLMSAPSIRFPAMVLAVSTRHRLPQLASGSVAAMNGVNHGSFSSATRQKIEISAQAVGGDICNVNDPVAHYKDGSMTLNKDGSEAHYKDCSVTLNKDGSVTLNKDGSVVETKDGETLVPSVLSPASSNKPPLSLPLPSLLSSESSATDFSTKVSQPLPLSKAAAAAAMVSLSGLGTSSCGILEDQSQTLSRDTTPANLQVVSQPASTASKLAPPYFLIPSEDRTKLVISPAGIEHLQSLLRKQGISEGYFIVTSPRTPSLPHRIKPAAEITNKTSGTDTNSKEGRQIPHPVPTTSCFTVSALVSNGEKAFGTKSANMAGIGEVLHHNDGNYTDICHPSSSSMSVLGSTDCGQSQKVESVVGEDEMGSKEDVLDQEEDDDESESESSSESRSSSSALIIETGEEEDEKMDVDRSCSSSPREHDADREDGEPGTAADSIKMISYPSSVATQSPAKDASWETESVRSDDARQCIPQSPLSLSDLVKQQQSRPGASKHLDYSFLTSPDNKMKEPTRKNDAESPQLASSENGDFQFPVPLCPASSYATSGQQQQQHSNATFQHSSFPPTPSFSADITFETTTHLPVLDSRISQHLQDTMAPSSSPKLISNTPSPKSPLSVQSSQALDHSTPLNPPMTPNTMLINLLNRVPTPFLTNPQDILSAPTPLETSSHETDSTTDYQIPRNKNTNVIFASKNLDFSPNQAHSQLASDDVANENLLYNQGSRGLSNTAGSFAPEQNSLELIASSYGSGVSRSDALAHGMGNSQLQSSYTMIASKSYDQSYGHCGMRPGPQALSFSESFQQESSCRDVCHSFQCKSCSQPLLVTINLDPDSPKYLATLSSREQDTESGNLMGNYQHTNVFGHTLNLTAHACNGSGSRPAPEKSGETDILRHLILNTSSSGLPPPSLPVQNLCSQQYDSTSSTFNLSQNHHAQASQFESRVGSFLEPEDQHKSLSGSGLDPSSGSFRAPDESYLHISHVHTQHVHTQPSPSYDSSSTSFQTSSHQSYDNTISSSFDNGNNPALQNQPSTSYIMETEMSSDESYAVQDMAKSNISMPHGFMESEGRIQHLAPFRSDNHQDNLFYQHPEQADPMHPHHYDPSGPHPSLDYHMDGLPPSQPGPHQYPTASLSHHDPSRMFSDHAGSVEYMTGQYQAQYYDAGGVPSSLPLFPQQCVVGSESPVVGSTAGHPCNIPFSTAPTGLQLEFRFPQEEEDGNNIEKQPVLPSASFSPPSVADQAATPDPGGMSIYNGSFPNLSMYDMYVRGGSSDARAVSADAVQELGSFCVECNIMYKTQCKFHQYDYMHVPDTPILSHARLTLPACLRLGLSSVVGHNNNTGVFAKEKIAVRTKFGPLIGSPVSCDRLSSTMSFSIWQTFAGPSVKVMDTDDESSSNWLMFVKPARISMEQNLVAFQQGSSVFFITRTDIESGQELLFWFSKDYARMLGITGKPKNASHQLCPHCPVCKQVFPDRKQVHSHVRLQHPKPCTKKCSYCSRRFSQVSHLNAHIASVHLNVKKFVCPTCGKRFSDSSNFRKHVKLHSDERLFKCVICGKDFRQKAHLKIHMNTHMPVKNEECGICGKRFTRAFTRRQHELQHTKLNKISCVHCDKVFYKQQIYRQHLKIHRNERKHACSHCSKAFRTKANLTRHGPACKQQKCVVIATHVAPQLAASELQAGEFLHSGHGDVSISGYSSHKSSSADSL